VLIVVKAMLRVGDTLVPLIFISDGIHLSNFADDKKEWPVYMTIGNLSSKFWQMPSGHTVVMVALLPIPMKNRNIPQKRLDE
jgi:membrane-associated phospholipid phosphatase